MMINKLLDYLEEQRHNEYSGPDFALTVDDFLDKIKAGRNDTLTEKLAEAHHEAWMAWSKELCRYENISPERRQRWEVYWVPYAQLPENIREFDRDWARKTRQIACEHLLADGYTITIKD